VTDVPERVRVALARAFSSWGVAGEGDRLQALVIVLTLAAAGNPVPSPSTVHAGALVRDPEDRWRKVLLVGELGVFASDPVLDSSVFLPWYKITAFSRVPPPPGTVTYRDEPTLF
jgi:hypothetical protein